MTNLVGHIVCICWQNMTRWHGQNANKVSLLTNYNKYCLSCSVCFRQICKRLLGTLCNMLGNLWQMSALFLTNRFKSMVCGQYYANLCCSHGSTHMALNAGVSVKTFCTAAPYGFVNNMCKLLAPCHDTILGLGRTGGKDGRWTTAGNVA